MPAMSKKETRITPPYPSSRLEEGIKGRSTSVLFFLILLIIGVKFWTRSDIFAQSVNLTGIGMSVSVKDQNAQNGEIVCSDAKGYSLCQNEYDSSIYGIINDSPSAAIEIGNLQNSHLVVSRGEVNVRVNSVNGNIKTGDFITTSKTAGVGELAVKTGFVIGTALADYSSNDKTAVGVIKVSINIHPRIDILGTTKENLIDVLRSGLSGLGVSPIAALRYVLASIMVLTSFGVGFIFFGRIAIAGVEAIGRNPLAGIRIQMSVILNIIIMVAVVAAGLGIAYLILAL